LKLRGQREQRNFCWSTPCGGDLPCQLSVAEGEVMLNVMLGKDLVLSVVGSGLHKSILSADDLMIYATVMHHTFCFQDRIKSLLGECCEKSRGHNPQMTRRHLEAFRSIDIT
jgi:hypothetical protein